MTAPRKQLTAAARMSLPALIAALCCYLFYSMNSGITITNDGSHFALFDSLVTTGSPELRNVRQFAFGDSASYDGRMYSDRNPGLALFTVAFYQGGKVLESSMRPLHLDPRFERNYTAGQRSRISLVMLVPAVSGGLVFLFAFLLGRQLGIGYFPAIAASLAICLGTILFRYATVFYSHAPAAALLSAALWLLFRSQGSPRSRCLCGGIFLLSCAVLVEHMLVLAFIPVSLYLWSSGGVRELRPATVACLCGATLLPLAVLMIYNFICFDSPFSIAHFHHASDPQNHQLSTLLRLDQTREAAIRLLFGAPEAVVGRQDLLGLFNGSPFLLAVLAFPLLIIGKQQTFSREYLVLGATIGLLVLGGASVFAPYGGWDRDYRYFAAALPLFAPFLGAVLQSLAINRGTTLSQVIQLLALGGMVALLLVSLLRQVQHLRHPGQTPYPQLLVNADAAAINVSLLLVLMVTAGTVMLVLAKTWRALVKRAD